MEKILEGCRRRCPGRHQPTTLLVYFLLGIVFWTIFTGAVLHHQLLEERHTCSMPSPYEPKKLCFVASIFGETLEVADRPSDVRTLLNCDRYRFFLFTNLPSLKAPGWTKLIKKHLPYKRMITKSRWGKFVAWRQPEISAMCQVVFYVDGYVKPILDHERVSKFQRLAWDITRGTGLAQVLHPNFQGQSLQEIYNGILERKKDLPENTNTTYNWLKAQTDYQSHLPYYLNKYFAYDPSSDIFHQVSTFFWDHYSTEEGSWRDQPLWAYTLYHFNITPLVLTKEGNIEMGGDLFGSGGRMGWKGHVYEKT